MNDIRCDNCGEWYSTWLENCPCEDRPLTEEEEKKVEEAMERFRESKKED